MKTFPLYFEDAQHEQLKKEAQAVGKSLKQYIMDKIMGKDQQQLAKAN